jgi:hypothetical protein
MSLGPKGPSAADLQRQADAERARAQVETDRINAEAAKAKEQASAETVANLASQAQKDLERRQKQKTLIGGSDEETGALTEGAAKAKRVSLIGALK